MVNLSSPERFRASPQWVDKYMLAASALIFFTSVSFYLPNQFHLTEFGKSVNWFGFHKYEVDLEKLGVEFETGAKVNSLIVINFNITAFYIFLRMILDAFYNGIIIFVDCSKFYKTVLLIMFMTLTVLFFGVEFTKSHGLLALTIYHSFAFSIFQISFTYFGLSMFWVEILLQLKAMAIRTLTQRGA